MQSGDIVCTYCKVASSIGNIIYDDDYSFVGFVCDSGNITKHAKGSKHQKAATAANHRDGNNPNTLTSYIRKRREELKSLGLNPNCMIAYTNRFADVKVKAQHRLQHFEAVQKWHVSGKTLPGEDNDDDDEEALSTTALGVKEAYNKPNAAKLALLIQVKVFGVIPDLIKHLSGEFDHVNMDFVNKLISLRNNLLTMSRKTGATITITHQHFKRMIPSKSLMSLANKK